MSEELQEHYRNARSKTQARCHPKGQSEHPGPEKCCHHQRCNSSISPKSGSTEFHSTYLKRPTSHTLRPHNLNEKTYKKDLLIQGEESRRREKFKQSTEPQAQKGAIYKVFKQSDKEEHYNILGYGEELAHGSEIDWQVGLGHKDKTDYEGDGSLDPLSGFYNENNKEMSGVAGRLQTKRKEGQKTEVGGKMGSIIKPVDCHFAMKSTTYSRYEQIRHKDEINLKKTRVPVKSSHNMFSGEMFSNEFYPNHIYTNGISTDDLSPGRTDVATLFPDICDAGEALADVEGFSDCDLFENIEPSWISDTEEVEDHEGAMTLSVKNCLKSSSESLSTFEEDDGEKAEEQSQTNHMDTNSQIFENSQDSVHLDKSEKEAESLSEISHNTSYSNSSLCSSESETTFDKLDKTETRTNQDRPETQQAVSPHSRSADLPTFEPDLQCASSATALKSEEVTSLQMQEDHCNGQKEDRLEVQGSPSILSTEKPEPLTEEHVYEEPQFQIKDFLQSNKYLMTRSISMEAPTNRLDPFCTSVSRKHRLMLHPQSHYKHNHFLGDSLPALSGSLGCLSSGIPGPPVMDIPPPFELSSITKRPIRKSTPALPNEVTACSRKPDFGFKRYFLPLRFLRKTEKRSDSRTSRSSSESSPQGSCKKLHLIRQCAGSPELHRAHDYSLPSSPSSVHLPKTLLRQSVHNNVLSATPNSWGMLGLEPDDLVHSILVQPLTLSKPRSFSSPNVDSSVYENVLNTSPHYENIQVRLLTPSSPNLRNLSSANDIDGYVDMSSLPGFQSKSLSAEQETESAYTTCSPLIRSDGTVSVSLGVVNTKEREKNATKGLTVNCSRTFYTVKELLDSETQHVKTLKLLNETIDADKQLKKLWNNIPAIYTLHLDLQAQLESCIKEWHQKEGIADIFLSKKAEFSVFSSYISDYDQKIKTMEQMEDTLDITTLKQQLLQVIVRVLQYHMLLTDYMKNLSQNSKELEDTKAAQLMVSGVTDYTKNSLKNEADLLRLVHIEHSVQGLKNLLQPGRVFVKEGTLMKVSRKYKQPRHLFLMSDILLYTYPQQDGKYRLINTLALTEMEVTKLLIENTQNGLKIEVKDITITLLASSCIERDDWFVTLNRTIADLGSVLAVPAGGYEVDKSVACLGENAPPLVSVSQVAVCMNCPVQFSLTHRRHHCHACGKVVCRDCCRNKVPLKYMKNRKAKVCDKCYSELCKNEGDVSMLIESSSRPLSTVFQNIHPTSLWKSRRGHASFSQVTGSEGDMSGTLQRSRNSKRSWKSLWFLLKDKVLYTYPQPEERLACESLPLMGFTVRSESEGESSVFQLYHDSTLFYTFRAQDTHTAQRWVSAMEEATVL
ncbi:FYVE, RhoGEF and PH domain-containing protein 5-like isoform X2 [Trichomycterus rosablanca]|uniref:FYVE, RhoGEF and PH domain-containing protein 5-like isoform X2 n=1 Tax=Trichomycterus rosablanca TaxID=2290929 RepID=UPI002F35E787